MSQSVEASAPSLELIFEAIHCFQQTGAIKAALELDVFTAIAEGNQTSSAIAARSKASERGVRVLCDYLTVIGLLTKTADRYGLTTDSGVFLNRKSPGYMGSAIEFLLAPSQVDPFDHLADAVRRGQAVDGPGVVAPDHPSWVKFAHAMGALMALPADLLANLLDTQSEPIRVLDIAAGHGLYGLAIARQNPRAHLTALDWPNVLAVARENARKAGVADRFSTIEGSAFDVDFKGDFDLILLPNFLHHFDPATVESFLRKVWSALAPKGRAGIVEFIPNEDRISPRVPAMFSMMMLPTTPGGDAYTYSQYEAILRSAGFASSSLHELHPTYFRAVIANK